MMSVAGRVKMKFEDDIEMTTGLNAIRLPRVAAMRRSVKAKVDNQKKIQDTGAKNEKSL